MNESTMIVSNFTGSSTTKKLVEDQIRERWGEDAAAEYDPFHNTLPFSVWRKYGYRVKHGERSIRSITFIEKKDSWGRVIKRIPRTVHLFYINQVEKMGDSTDV